MNLTHVDVPVGEPVHTPSAPVALAPGEVEWNLLGTLRTLVRARFRILLLAFLGFLLGFALALYLKPVFRAEAVFMPPKNTDLGTPTATVLFSSGTDLSDTYVGMLASRSVADDVIARLHLQTVWETKTLTDARARLNAISGFSVSKNSMVVVDVKLPDPKLAADIANAYLDALYKLNGQMVSSASDRRRAFFEDQLAEQKKYLNEAEQDLKQTQLRSGTVLPAGEAAAGLQAVASLQAQIGLLEAKLAVLANSETAQNPEYIQTRSELNQVRGQLARQQSGSSRNGLAANGQLPELTLEAARKEREVKLREGIYDSFVQQYERARLSAIDPGPQLQIIDRAVVPEHKFGPSRTLLVLGFTLAGFLLGLAHTLLMPPLRRLRAQLKETPAAAGRSAVDARG